MSETIAIIGAGVAGLATAIKLRQLGLKVSVFEAGNYNKLVAGEHLGADAKLEFQKLNFPQKKLNPVMLPCREVRNAWGQSVLHYNESIFNPYGDGIILTRPAFDRALSQYAVSIGVHLFLNTRVEKIEATKQVWDLFLKNSRTAFQASFLVDASGRTSKFYKKFGVEKIVYDDLIGITKRLVGVKEISNKTTYLLVESTPNGWWYSVQLQTGTIVATFMTDATVLQVSSLNQNAFWKKNLEASIYTKKRLSACLIPENCFTQSAHTHNLGQFSGKNWLSVGDAAIAYDPLSSMGIIKGLRMGQDAAIAINERLFSSEGIGLDYDKKYKEQFKEYLFQKRVFYGKESRWNHLEFWYKRNIRISEIETFSTFPHTNLVPASDQATHSRKLDFLKKQSPTIDFALLLESIKTEKKAMDAIGLYLQKRGENSLPKALLQGLEGMLQIGLLSSKRS